MANSHPLVIPLHPMLVHFPIAFYFLELVLIILWIVRNDPAYQRFSLFAFYMGYGVMLTAMAAGLFDVGGLEKIRGAIRRHFIAALAVFLIQTARALFYLLTRRRSSEYRGVKLAGALIANGAVAYAAFLGGLLVYD